MRSRTFRFECLAALSVSVVLSVAGCSQKQPQGERAAQEAPAQHAESPDRATAPVEPAATSPDGATEVAHAERTAAPALEIPTGPADAPEPTPSQAPPPAPLPASQAPLPLDNVPTADLQMPKVVLTKHHAELNKVGVGDAFPNFELPNLKGEQTAITKLLGPKLTLVIFWNALQPTGLEELADLARYHQPRFGDKGLSIVAVNTGDPSQLAGELVQKAGAAYPVLSDADGAALQQVATGKLPRTYLLDPAGKILWLDMEYSPTTRRDLAAAIRKSIGGE